MLSGRIWLCCAMVGAASRDCWVGAPEDPARLSREEERRGRPDTVMADDGDVHGLVRAVYWDGEEVGEADNVQTTLAVTVSEQSRLAEALRAAGLHHCFVFELGRLHARVAAEKGHVLSQLCALLPDRGATDPRCVRRDLSDALLDKFRRASVGSYHHAYIPGLGSPRDGAEFVTAIGLSAEQQLYGDHLLALLRNAQASLASSGFRAVLGSGGAYVVEEPALSWQSAAYRAAEALVRGADAALHARARRALCAAFDKQGSPLCTWS